MIQRLLAFIICIYVVLTPSIVFASAAEELWKYEPTLKDMKVNVTAHKVDHLGNAVNDNTYKTQIDPKTAANKTAQGRVGINRLLKVSGWGYVGAAALEALLEAVDWVIDPEAQSIWRNKKNPDPTYACEYYDASGKIMIFRTSLGGEHRCPLTAIERGLDAWVISNKFKSAEFIRWVDVDPFGDMRPGKTIRFEHDYVNSSDVKRTDTRTITANIDPDQTTKNPPQKEIMTPDVLSDYINHTHPDYADPTLAPKLDPKYNPNEIIPPLWKPQTDYEYDNSPTVDIIKKDLDKQNPNSPDPEVKPNPETGGMTLPSFCDWAKVVCDFVKDFNKEPDLKDRDNTVQIDELPITPPVANYFSWNAYCPFQNKSSQISINDQTTSVDSDLSSWCTMASEVKPFVIAAGSIASLMIISGVGIKED